MAVEIRRADPRDAGALHEVAAATFPLACPPHTTRAAIDEFIADHLSETSFDGYLADPQRALFLALEDETAIGYTMVIFADPTDADVVASITIRPTAELSKVYVREGHHGAGIAGRLVELSIAAAAERGAAGIWLGVNQENARANRFYEKQGFALVGTKRFLVGGQYEDDFVRERPI
jgi:GNAT superfamily N-acetyltransferase